MSFLARLSRAALVLGASGLAGLPTAAEHPVRPLVRATAAQRELADEILQDARMDAVKELGQRLLRAGMNAGSGYGEVWIRDLNTFIVPLLDVAPHSAVREALLVFFHFQGEDGNIVDGYIAKDRGLAGYDYRLSATQPKLKAHKNTVETDQESSLVLAVCRYVRKTGDRSLLDEVVGSIPVRRRLEMALEYPLEQRFSAEHGLVWGATTVDWGDVQPEHPWGVELDEKSHRAIDVYDNALLMTAIADYVQTVCPDDASQTARWNAKREALRQAVRERLWDAEAGKFRPHLYLAGSPFPADFDEDAIYYFGGTTVALEAGLLAPEEVAATYRRMRDRVEAAGAATIGLTVYPPYPEGYFLNPSMRPYSYQNGGDWTWFGARTVRQLAEHGLVEEAYRELAPMLDRVLAQQGFFEWWTLANQPQGSGEFRSSAGVLIEAIDALRAWAAAIAASERPASRAGAEAVGRENHQPEPHIVWQIGQADDSGGEFALAPDGYARFLERDFGWEDRYFLIGRAQPHSDWPYVLPGPADGWGGNSVLAGRRTHTLTILFGLAERPPTGDWKFVVDLVDVHPERPPLLKIETNGRASYFPLPPGGSEASLAGQSQGAAREHVVELPLAPGELRAGGNEIRLTTLDGSWLLFDQVRLEGPAEARLEPQGDVFVRQVAPADYETISDGAAAQPLLVDVEHVAGAPRLGVRLDGVEIFAAQVEQGRYAFEASMPAVSAPTTSNYEIVVDGRTTGAGQVQRAPQRTITPADYVDTRIGTAHSRWMIAPGPWMPFGMVKLSPDTQETGWQAGYDPSLENIAGFSHIHEWTMAGVSLMPTNGPLQIYEGRETDPDSGYRSRLDKATEQAPIGYYAADLTDYGIKAELTSTTRCGFHRYAFPPDRDGRVLLDLQFGAEYALEIQRAEIRQVGPHRLEGLSEYRSECWGKEGVQQYTVHFVVEFDRPIKACGVWRDGKIEPGAEELVTEAVQDAGAYVEFDVRENPVVQARVGISLVSVENAALNLRTEVTEPFAWDFAAIRARHVDAWNDLLGRIRIATPDRREKQRFYNNLYRSFCRNTWSDVNGQWVDAEERVRQLPEGDVALGCDAFWNTFWNLNQLWNLAAPEWSSRWVRSQLAMYDSLGWLAKGPAGMEYIPVMVAEHEIPLIVAAYQMGIRDFDADQALTAVRKMQTTPPTLIGGGLAGNRDLEAYLQHRYVPYDKGRFSNSLEYAYDDWTVGQFALALGREDVAAEFLERGGWWRNAIDPDMGYARMRGSDGKFVEDFDFYKTGANEHYVEGNAWQLTFFVPQDVPGLAEAIGVDRFRERLEWGFTESYPWRFNAPNEQYWDFPVMHGNQQSMHFAFLFNWVDRPWLTQRWSRAILGRYYGYGLANAYLGDEDQGQMSAWFVMAAIGLFQTDGGCRVTPIYEIGSPLYEEVVIDLGGRYGRGQTFTIRARNASRKNQYVQSATLNGQPLTQFWFPASVLLQGGELTLEMGPEPRIGGPSSRESSGSSEKSVGSFSPPNRSETAVEGDSRGFLGATAR